MGRLSPTMELTAVGHATLCGRPDFRFGNPTLYEDRSRTAPVRPSMTRETVQATVSLERRKGQASASHRAYHGHLHRA